MGGQGLLDDYMLDGGLTGQRRRMRNDIHVIMEMPRKIQIPLGHYMGVAKLLHVADFR